MSYIIDDFSVNQTANRIKVHINYVFNAIDANVSITFLNTDGTILKVERVYIPVEVYATWNDDSIILNYVETQLGIVIGAFVAE